VDVSRFRSGDNLCSYAGIVPSTYNSGGVARHGRITREGSRWLRWAVFETATTHIKYDTAITRAYHHIAERGVRRLHWWLLPAGSSLTLFRLEES